MVEEKVLDLIEKSLVFQLNFEDSVDLAEAILATLLMILLSYPILWGFTVRKLLVYAC